MNGTNKERSTQGDGFTLVELSIVLVILGVALGSVVPLYNQRVQQRKLDATREELAAIKIALVEHYREKLTLPDADANYTVPITALRLPPGADTDEIYAGSKYAYVVTRGGVPHAQLFVDGGSIGATAAVVLSRGRNLKGDLENKDLKNGKLTQWTTDPNFDDLVTTISETELRAVTAWRREIDEDTATLNVAAAMLADNDDDLDGFVDEDAGDPNGNWDGARSWALMDAKGLDLLVQAGRIPFAHQVIDPWGRSYRWEKSKHRFYSTGPNKIDEGGGGDDLMP